MKWLTNMFYGLLMFTMSGTHIHATRWYTQTVRVYIEPGYLEDNTVMDSTNMVYALHEWETEKTPRFVIVGDSLNADIVVRWVPHFDKSIAGLTRTHADTVWDRSELRDATIWIAMDRFDGSVLADWQRRSIMIHEVGHALGLEHSTDSLSIMYPVVSAVDLTMADKMALDSLYSDKK